MVTMPLILELWQLNKLLDQDLFMRTDAFDSKIKILVFWNVSIQPPTKLSHKPPWKTYTILTNTDNSQWNEPLQSCWLQHLGLSFAALISKRRRGDFCFSDPLILAQVCALGEISLGDRLVHLCLALLRCLTDFWKLESSCESCIFVSFSAS